MASLKEKGTPSLPTSTPCRQEEGWPAWGPWPWLSPPLQPVRTVSVQEALGPRGYTQVRCTCRSLEAPLGPWEPGPWELLGLKPDPRKLLERQALFSFLRMTGIAVSSWLCLPCLSPDISKMFLFPFFPRYRNSCR